MSKIVLFLTLQLIVVTNCLRLENKPIISAQVQIKESITTPTKGIIDLEDEEMLPQNNERQMIGQEVILPTNNSSMLLQSHDDEPQPQHKEKLSKIIKKHDEVGQELKSLKQDLQQRSECGGWKNIENFFKGKTGGARAKKLLTFLGMLKD